MSTTSIGFDIFAKDRASDTFDKLGKNVKQTESKFSKFSKAAVAGGLLAGAALVKLGGDAISLASDVSESASKVGVVFGDHAAQVLAASETSATAMGISKAAYLEAAGGLGNLLVSLKVQPKAAADMSQQMVKLAGDMASFNNVPVADALAAIRSGLTGETEPLKRFGVNMNDATLKAAALKLGLIKTTKDAMSPQTKALAAQSLIMKQTGTAQGDFARTSSGLANQQKIATARIEDMQATIGRKLLPVMTSAVAMGLKMLTWTEKNGETVKKLTIGIGAFVVVLGTAKVITLAHAAALSLMAAKIAVFSNVSKVATVGQWLLNAALTANPIGLVVVAIGLLAAGLVVAYKKSATFRTIVDGAFKAIGAAGRWLWNEALQPVIGFILKGFASVTRTIGGVLIALGRIPGFGWAKTAGEMMVRAAGGADRLAKNIRKIQSPPPIRLRYYITTTGKAPSLGGSPKGVFNVPGRASGGPVKAGTSYLINEEGQEIFTPDSNGYVTNARDTARALGGRGGSAGGGTVININVDANRALDPTAVGQAIHQVLLQLKRTSGAGLALG